MLFLAIMLELVWGLGRPYQLLLWYCAYVRWYLSVHEALLRYMDQSTCLNTPRAEFSRGKFLESHCFLSGGSKVGVEGKLSQGD